jgi:phosphate transport system substrate-binding protein
VDQPDLAADRRAAHMFIACHLRGHVMRRGAVLVVAAAVLTGISTGPTSGQEVMGATAVTGAGSTFAYPILSKWAQAYQRWVAGGGDYPTTGAGLDDPPASPVLDYEPIGSLAGTMRVKDRAVDFGASDVPLKSEDLQKLGLVQFPIVIGGVVAAVNIDGVGPGEIQFTGELLADIYLGKVQSWTDPAIRTLNPALELPDAKIIVFRRSEGSGTTFNFSNYLSKVSPQWRDAVGFDLLVSWPTGAGAKGNDGVSQAVRNTKNSIGYVEYAHAIQTRLSYALIRNQAGTLVKPDASSFQAAAATAAWEKASDFNLLLTDTPGQNAYPIVATVFILMHKTNSPRRARAALSFFTWSLEKGAKDATGLGYVPLPPALVAQVKDYWAKNLKPGT